MDVILFWVDPDKMKARAFVTIKKVPTCLECTPMTASISDLYLYEMNKKLFIQYEGKIQHPSVSSDEKIPEAHCMSISEALTTVTTHWLTSWK